MKKVIFVEIDDVLAVRNSSAKPHTKESIVNATVDEDAVEIVNTLSNTYDIVLYTLTRDEDRMYVEDFICKADVYAKEIITRSDHDFTDGSTARWKMIKSYFRNDASKMLLNTKAVFTNNERFACNLRNEEILTLQTESI